MSMTYFDTLKEIITYHYRQQDPGGSYIDPFYRAYLINQDKKEDLIGLFGLPPPPLQRSQTRHVMRDYPHPYTHLPVPVQYYESASTYSNHGDNGIQTKAPTLETLFHIQTLLDKISFPKPSKEQKKQNAEYILLHGKVPQKIEWYKEIPKDEDGTWSWDGPTEEFFKNLTTKTNIRKMCAISRAKIIARKLRIRAAEKVFAPGGIGAQNAKQHFEQQMGCLNQKSPV